MKARKSATRTYAFFLALFRLPASTLLRRAEVNGEKKWITNGVWCEHFTTAVRTGGPGIKGISLLLIERKCGAFSYRQSVLRILHLQEPDFFSQRRWMLPILRAKLRAPLPIVRHILSTDISVLLIELFIILPLHLKA